jgi:hypothetical protein
MGVTSRAALYLALYLGLSSCLVSGTARALEVEAFDVSGATAVAHTISSVPVIPGAYTDVDPSSAVLFASSSHASGLGLQVSFTLTPGDQSPSPAYFQVEGPSAPEPSGLALVGLALVALARGRRAR